MKWPLFSTLLFSFGPRRSSREAEQQAKYVQTCLSNITVAAARPALAADAKLQILKMSLRGNTAHHKLDDVWLNSDSVTLDIVHHNFRFANKHEVGLLICIFIIMYWFIIYMCFTFNHKQHDARYACSTLHWLTKAGVATKTSDMLACVMLCYHKFWSELM